MKKKSAVWAQLFVQTKCGGPARMQERREGERMRKGQRDGETDSLAGLAQITPAHILPVTILKLGRSQKTAYIVVRVYRFCHPFLAPFLVFYYCILEACFFIFVVDLLTPTSNK